ncbi:MAG: integral rane protein interacts with FtsH [Candidatus Eremiobacteraeota bacterium]|jgi:modulator of FtsH protease|nr:integral rane protein interacts with FtsH [Candidatus Eremiobacteraeota bacterium]
MYQSRYQPRTAYGPAVNTPALLGQVLGITGVGFLITAVAAYLFRGISPGGGLIALIAGFVLLFVMQAVRNNGQVALLVFYAFTFLEGIGLAPTIQRYVSAIGPDVVVNAAGTTGFGMLVLGGVAFVFSVDWRRFTGIAFGLLIALIVVGIISAFTHFLHPGTYAWLTLGVFTLITLIDFSRIRAGGDGNSPVQLAVSIYLDAINIFLALLQLFGMRSSRDD